MASTGIAHCGGLESYSLKPQILNQSFGRLALPATNNESYLNFLSDTRILSGAGGGGGRGGGVEAKP